MNLSRCPHCHEELSRIEKLDGKCISCGKEFEKAYSTSHGEPEDSPYHASASITEPLNLRQKESIALLIAFLATLLTPFGMIASCIIAFEKGDTICASSGCTAEATKQVEYSGGLKCGYCDEHAKNPKHLLSLRPYGLPYVLCVLGLLFVGYEVLAFFAAQSGKVVPRSDPTKKPRDPFRRFLWLAVFGIVGMNGAFWLAARYLS